MNQDKCPICLTDGPTVKQLPKGNTIVYHEISCKQCGRFVVHDRQGEYFSDPKSPVTPFRHLASAWVYRRGRTGTAVDLSGIPSTLAGIKGWEAEVRSSGLPVTVPEKKDAFLLALASRSGVTPNAPNLRPLLPHGAPVGRPVLRWSGLGSIGVGTGH